MSVSYVNSISQDLAQAGSHTITMPSGIQAGDLILIVLHLSISGVTSVSSGYTNLGTISVSGITYTRKYYKIADGSETEFVIDHSTTPDGVAGIIVLRGDFSTPPIIQQEYLTSTGTSIITTTALHGINVNNAVVFFALSQDAGVVTASTPSGYTEVFDNGYDDGTGRSMACSYKLYPNATENPSCTASATCDYVWGLLFDIGVVGSNEGIFLGFSF